MGKVEKRKGKAKCSFAKCKKYGRLNENEKFIIKEREMDTINKATFFKAIDRTTVKFRLCIITHQYTYLYPVNIHIYFIQESEKKILCFQLHGMHKMCISLDTQRII